MLRLNGLRRAALGLVAASALLLSGCVVILSESSVQLQTIGKVRITTVICATDVSQGQHLGCPDGGNSNSDAPDDRRGQLLMGYRIPEGTVAPASFRASAPQPAIGTITFSKSSTFTNQLETLSPAPGGQEWVGYLSNDFDYDAGPPCPSSPCPPPEPAELHRLTVAAEFGLPRNSDGGPYRGPFRFLTTVGAREVTSSLPASRPVQCGQTITDGDFEHQCVDDPQEEQIRNNRSRATRDLGILTGSRGRAAPGDEATLTFPVEFAGSVPSGTTFALSAATTLDGADATPASATLTPASDSTTPVAVDVQVPRKAKAGDYLVSLTATLPNGQRRDGFAVLTVPDASVSKPQLGGDRVQDVLDQGFAVVEAEMAEDGTLKGRGSFSIPGAALSAIPSKKFKFRSVKRSVRAGKEVRLKFKLSKRAKRALRRGFRERSRFGAKLTVIAIDKAGNSRRRTKKVKLTR